MKKWTRVVIFVIIILLAASTVFFWQAWQTEKANHLNTIVYLNQLEKISGVGRLQTAHHHANLTVFINGKERDFAKEELQAPETGDMMFWSQNKVSKFVHLHPEEGNNTRIHVHATGITLSMLFRSLDGNLNETCMTLPPIFAEPAYCTNATMSMDVIINGQKIAMPQYYPIAEDDNIIVTYGKKNRTEG
ncbi:hypothetical protein HYW21_09455 [Candidatus Woesearchaeota archaeon]|nr:hypothetical protein [Candidatus Woesearchaeota archaeon]